MSVRCRISPALPFLACMLGAVPAALHAQARPISPYLLGQNLWDGRFENAGAHRLWPSMKNSGFRIIRVGGILNNEQMPDNAVMLHQVDSIKAIGAEPMIQVSSLESPQKAADLVRHLNVTSGRKVKFWSIGNEPTCGAAADAGTVAAIAANIKERASAMKQADPSIRIAVGEECYWRTELYGPLVGGNQDVTGKDGSGRYHADIVSFHSYPFPGADKTKPYTRQQVLDQGAATLRSFLSSCTTAVAAANAKHGRTGDAALSCAVTEFNITYWNVGNVADNSVRGVGSRSFLNGQFMAETMGIGTRMGAFTLMPWSIWEGEGKGGGSDLGMFDGQGPFTPRASYHHAKLVGLYLAGESVPASSGEPLLKAFAARLQDTAALLILNQEESKGWRLAVGLDGSPSAGAGTKVTVAAGFPGSHGDTIGPQETLLLRFHRTGSLLTRIRYDVGKAEAGQAPAKEDFPPPLDLGRPQGAREGAWTASIGPGNRLQGTTPDGEPWEVRLMTLRGEAVGNARSSQGRWDLALPDGRGLLILSMRRGNVLYRRIVSP